MRRNTPKMKAPDPPPEKPIEVYYAEASCEDCPWAKEGRAGDVGHDVAQHEIENPTHSVVTVDEWSEVLEP